VADVKRPYRSPRREAAAGETRRAVLAAATALFVEQGWASTTVAQVAERAGVSRPTVFAVGSKADLLRLGRDLAMAGDAAPQPVAARSGFQQVLAAPDPASALALFAEHVTRVLSRYARLDEVLHQGAGADEELRALWESSEAQRRRGAELVAASLAGTVPGLDLDRATDVLWVLMAAEPYRQLVHGCGWTDEQYAGWLADALRAHLLGVR
jgi:AcrR family transcriptional regulator